MDKLYDPVDGYTEEAHAIMRRVYSFADSLFRENPHLRPIELSGLIVSSVEEARVSVSLDRRMSEELRREKR